MVSRATPWKKRLEYYEAMLRYARLAAEHVGRVKPTIRDPPRKSLMPCTIPSCDQFVNDFAEESENSGVKSKYITLWTRDTPKTILTGGLF